MERSSIELLKSLNLKFENTIKKGVSKFPRRKSDFVLKKAGKYPLYPFENFISTVEFFSKSENIEKFSEPIEIIKSILDYRDNNYLDLLQKSEYNIEPGLYFHISGKKIKEAIEGKISKLKTKLKERQEIVGKTQSDQEKGQIVDNSIPYLDQPIAANDWITDNLQRDIDRFKSIARNIDEKKTYKLGEYDLERYGL